jgi:hypothetical protein
VANFCAAALFRKQNSILAENGGADSSVDFCSSANIENSDDNAISGAEVLHSAVLFGLYRFFAAVIVAENNGEELGSLEMYCCVSRNPSPREFQLIERAVCLTAIAIKRYRETGDGGDCRTHGIRPARGYVPETPTSMN